ncbi:unnamed protein product [Agarophyton chilense]|eukprot:gb/GEZJ01004610.1/.p1 GENE.gb/GEZJ01004610.1/~~gb/GEZJ01004610.1/.p1  ORF type:complete len:177 (+),score=32.97 gb/GEZJ01004610.1/:559-1089(+)
MASTVPADHPASPPPNARKRSARRSVSVGSGSTACDSDQSVAAAPPEKNKKSRSDQVHTNLKQQPVPFPAQVLLDLAGSTSAEVRRMNDDERALVHYKRRLRNRQSAKRSRARRQATLTDIQAEVDDLRQLTASLIDRCIKCVKNSERQTLELETLRKENQFLESMLRSSNGNCSL